jgi:hypothetical protein
VPAVFLIKCDVVNSEDVGFPKYHEQEPLGIREININSLRECENLKGTSKNKRFLVLMRT